MPEEEEVREQLKEAIDKGQVDLVLAPSDATFQKLWDHFTRWTAAVSIADIAFRREDPEEFVDNLILDWVSYASKEMEQELQTRIDKYGLQEHIIEEARSRNKAETQEVAGQLTFLIKNALKRMRGE